MKLETVNKINDHTFMQMGCKICILNYNSIVHRIVYVIMPEIEQKREAANKQASGECSRSNTQETGCCSKQYNIKKEDPPLKKLVTYSNFQH
jgi:hypothetical protein